MTSDINNPCLKLKLSPKLTLTWKNISYTIEKKVNGNSLMAFLGLQQMERERLLNKVSGTVRAGVLLSIMGPSRCVVNKYARNPTCNCCSGCGKTTLLATLSHRLKGEITGDIILNGKSINAENMIRVSGFVPQKDLAVESLTLQEHMEFMARMKMDKRVKSSRRKNRIEVLLMELGLTKCRNLKLSTLSGGERKRASLAVQLLTEPSILFCDEPTTGLDSYSATTVMKTLGDVAKRGRIVICSLHQPASGIFDFCDQVLLLSTGRVAFHGRAADAMDFFESVGLYCPPTFNSAEYYISQLSVTRGNEEYSYKKINFICDEFERSRYGQDIKLEIEETCTSEAEILPALFSEVSKTTTEWKRICVFTEVGWLTWRTFVDYKRNSTMILLRFVLYMFIGVLICTPYVNIMKTLEQEGIQNIQGLMYLVVIETVFNFNYSVYYTIPRELPTFLRDIASGLYSPVSYYISQVIVLLPGTLFQPLVFCALVFTVAGFSGELEGFMYFVIPIMFAASSASAVGCLMSTSFKSVDTAFLISVPIDFVTLVFCGIYVQLGNLSPWIAWIKYISQFYYGLEAVSLSQWQQIQHIVFLSGTCAEDCLPDPEEPCISSGLGVLEKYGYQPGRYYADLFGLLAIFSISHFVGFLAVRYRSREEAVY